MKDKIRLRLPLDFFSDDIKFYDDQNNEMSADELTSIYLHKIPLEVSVSYEQKIEALNMAIEIEKLRPVMTPPVTPIHLWEMAKTILNLVYKD